MNPQPRKIDLRVRRTYKYLWEALLHLMSERDFESISVTDICERAMVHRTTFYKHYEDKYGLLYQGIRDQLGLLFDALRLPAGQTASVNEQIAMVTLLMRLFGHVLEQRPFYRLMLVGEGVGKFHVIFRKSLVEEFLNRSDAHLHRSDKRTMMRYVLRAQAHAGVLVSAIAWWLDNDCPFTPAEMGQFLWDDAFS